MYDLIVEVFHWYLLLMALQVHIEY